MMPAGYSTLFTLGLTSMHAFPSAESSQSRPHATQPPSTPTRRKPQIVINTQLTPSHSKTARRRRRSSVTVSNSPMGGIKSPSRAAAMSLNKVVLLSPSRHASGRSGDRDMDDSSMGLVQRLRSGSVGTMLRTRRGLVRKAAGTPPTAPLPAIPLTSRSGMCTHPSLNAVYVSGGTRGILEKRQENMHCRPAMDGDHGDSRFLTVDSALRLAMAMETPPASCVTSPVDEKMEEIRG